MSNLLELNLKAKRERPSPFDTINDVVKAKYNAHMQAELMQKLAELKLDVAKHAQVPTLTHKVEKLVVKNKWNDYYWAGIGDDFFTGFKTL